MLPFNISKYCSASLPVKETKNISTKRHSGNTVLSDQTLWPQKRLHLRLLFLLAVTVAGGVTNQSLFACMQPDLADKQLAISLEPELSCSDSYSGFMKYTGIPVHGRASVTITSSSFTAEGRYQHAVSRRVLTHSTLEYRLNLHKKLVHIYSCTTRANIHTVCTYTAKN